MHLKCVLAVCLVALQTTVALDAPRLSQTVAEFTDTQFRQAIAESGKVIMVDFYAVCMRFFEQAAQW